MAQAIFLGEALKLHSARRESLARNFLKIRIGGVPRRNLELGEGIVHAADLDVAALGDRDGSRHGVRHLAENLRHFLGGLEIELVGREFHPLGVAHCLARLDAHQHFLRVRVGLGEVVAIVRGHEWNSGFARKVDEIAVDPRLDFQALVLNFQKEVALAENVAQAIGVRSRLIVFFVEQRVGDFAA